MKKSKKNLYDLLGVQKNASKADIKKAYRKKALETHPDQGGDKEHFQQIALAHRILSDDDKRKKYDEGADPDSMSGGNSPEDRAKTLLVELYVQSINQMQPHHDLIDLMRYTVNQNTLTLKQKKNELKSLIAKYEKAKNRTINKTIKKAGEKSFLVNAIEGVIEGVNQDVKKIDGELEVAEIILTILKDYNYLVETVAQNPFGISFTGGTTGNDFWSGE